MAIKLFSPAVICIREWLYNPEDKVEGLTPEYLEEGLIKVSVGNQTMVSITIPYSIS